jgi:ribosomal protein L11 methyltransferase
MSALPRRWLELGVRSPSAGEREALLAEGLVSLGARAVAEEDGWYVSHFEEPPDVDVFVARVRQILLEVGGLAEVEVRTRWCAHEDWAETWKRGLRPRRLTPRILVTTSWQPVESAAGDIVLVLDPGMAFGTAEHGTTRGCLRLLDRTVREGDRIVDVGAGSGILSIAAARMGATEVLAVEGDPLAIEAIADNVARNSVTGTVTWAARWADVSFITALGPRDGVVANIETGVLGPLLPGFARILPAGAWLILSGILVEDWDTFRGRVERVGFRLEETDTDGEWRSGVFRREGGQGSSLHH